MALAAASSTSKGRAVRTARGSGAPERNGDYPLVVLIEDDTDVRETLQAMLERSGYRVAAYSQARRALADLDAGLRPVVVLLDLMMPGMNGWQFRLEQRQRPHLSDLPVVAVSADLSAPAVAMDVDAFVQKPFDLEHLLAVMERVLLARERRRLIAKSIELEQLRALGMVVAGVTHEINNPLSYMLGHLELAHRRLEATGITSATAQGAPLADVSEHLSRAREGGERIAAVVKLLSTFSRATSGEPSSPVDVVQTVEAATRIAMHRIRRHAHLELDLAPVLPVLASEGQLAQVLVNLLVNASQAIAPNAPESNTISVRTRMVDEHVLIEVSDTGKGISPEQVEHIFEPFYTTKRPGEGTGLGLSISKEIVESFGGKIEVESAPGQGTTVRVVLPCYRASTSEIPEDPALGGSEPANGDTRLACDVVDCLSGIRFLSRGAIAIC